MEYLFDRWEEVRRDLIPGALLLPDYDGTLTPIVERPELAILSPDMRELLRRASRHYKLGVISGRSLADIKRLVDLGGIFYVGNHGFEISGPGVKLIKPEAERARPVVAKLCEELRWKLSDIKGTIIEDKGPTASVHYRSVADPKALEDLNGIFGEAVAPYVDSGTLRVTRGKKVFEIRPNIGWDKGKAVLWIIDKVNPSRDLMPVYVGDDRTDEDAFFALKDRGVTVLVSREVKESNAKYFVRDVGEVKAFLEKLISLRAK